KLKLDEKSLGEWDGKLKQKTAAVLKSRSVQAYLRIFGAKSKEEKLTVAALDDNGLIVDVGGNKMPVAWKNLAVHDRANLARGLVSDDDADSLLIAAAFAACDDQSAQAEDFIARAAIKDASGAHALK